MTILQNNDNSLFQTAASFGPGLYFQKLSKKSSPKAGPLLILHDLCEHHGHYTNLASDILLHSEFFSQIFLMDMRGHGQSAGTRGHIESFEQLQNDIEKMISLMTKHSSKKVVILAQGVSSLAVLRLLGSKGPISQRISAVIFSSPLFALSRSFQNIMHYSAQLPKFLDKMRLPLTLKGSFWTHDPNYQLLIDRDPLFNQFTSFGALAQINNATDNLGPCFYFFDHPCLFLLGDDDPFIDVNKTALLAKSIPGHLSRVCRYFHAGHCHLHEKNKDKVLEDIYTWLHEILFRTTLNTSH